MFEDWLVAIFYLFGFTALVFEPLYYFGCSWSLENCRSEGGVMFGVSELWRVYGEWDPLFLNVPSWLRVMCTIEVFLFGPLYVVCAYGLQTRRAWLPSVALPFCGALIYSTLVYFALEYIERLPGTNLEMVVLVNVPWTICPLLLVFRLLFSPEWIAINNEVVASRAAKLLCQKIE